MPTSLFTTDPASLSPAERMQTVAAILAAGLIRLSRPIPDSQSTLPLVAQGVSKKSLNELADAADKSVTVQAG